MSNRSTILTTVGIAVLMLVIGIAIGSVAFPVIQTKTVTEPYPFNSSTKVPCTSTATAHTLSDPNGAGVFYIQVNYTGSWSGAIFGYNGGNNSSPVYVLCMSGQGGNFATTAPDKNPNGMSTVCVEAQKQDIGDSSNSTLTVGITWGAFLRSANTTFPFGATQVCETIVP